MPPEETLFVEPRNQQEQPMSQAAPYLVAIFGITFIGCASILTLEIARPGGDYNSQAAYTIVGILTTVLTVLLGIIKSIANGQHTQTVIRKIDRVDGKIDIAAGRAQEAAVASAAAPVVAAAAVREVLEKSLPRGPIQVDATLHTDAQPKNP